MKLIFRILHGFCAHFFRPALNSAKIHQKLSDEVMNSFHSHPIRPEPIMQAGGMERVSD